MIKSGYMSWTKHVGSKDKTLTGQSEGGGGVGIKRRIILRIL
jgi:hypothetical protein